MEKYYIPADAKLVKFKFILTNSQVIDCWFKNEHHVYNRCLDVFDFVLLFDSKSKIFNYESGYYTFFVNYGNIRFRIDRGNPGEIERAYDIFSDLPIK